MQQIAADESSNHRMTKLLNQQKTVASLNMPTVTLIVTLTLIFSTNSANFQHLYSKIFPPSGNIKTCMTSFPNYRGFQWEQNPIIGANWISIPNTKRMWVVTIWLELST